MPNPDLAYILLWFPEATQTFILDEVNTLRRLGAAVRVYTLYGPRPPARLTGMAPAAAPVRHLGLASLGGLLREFARAWTSQGHEVRKFLARVIWRRWRSLETAGEALWATLSGVFLARLFLREGVRHIHAPWADGPATAAWVASRLSGIPFSFCAHAHDIYPPDGALTEKLQAAAFVRVISRVNRDYLAALAPLEAHKLAVIYCGAPLSAMPAPPRPRQGPYRLVAIGRLVAKKGFDQLLAACRHLLAEGLDFRLTIAGEGPQRPKLQSLIDRYGLQARVDLPGFLPHRQVPTLLHQADLVIMPCRVDASGDRDGIPNVILESLVHQVPVVATEVSGISEAVYPGKTGWLVPPDDPPALARAMMEALTRPNEARRRAQAGARLVREKFDSVKNYRQLKNCLEKTTSET